LIKSIPNPITEEELKQVDMDHENPNWTLCETLRTIYHLAIKVGNNTNLSKEELDVIKEIKERAKFAVAIAKRMDYKLKEYKLNYDDGWYRRKKEDKK
jgi:hypothetical protein